MFEQDVIDFYKRFVLCYKRGGRYRLSRPCFSNSQCWVDFLFTLDNSDFPIRYNCTNISPANAEYHAENIHSIFRVCINESGPLPLIFPAFCSSCNKLHWSDCPKDARRNAPCVPCHKLMVKDILTQNPGSSSYVYLIHDRTHNIVKIGYSSRPEKRLSALQTGSGGDLAILALLPGGMKLEKEIHRLFKDKKVKNEWFEYCEEIVSFFDNYRSLKNEL